MVVQSSEDVINALVGAEDAGGEPNQKADEKPKRVLLEDQELVDEDGDLDDLSEGDLDSDAESLGAEEIHELTRLYMAVKYRNFSDLDLGRYLMLG